MISVVGISLKEKGKIYYFLPNGLTLKKGVTVILETERGLQFGRVEKPLLTLKEEDMKKIANLINMTVEDYENKKEEIHNEVAKICKKYPLYN